ncbi:MAG: M15 family metallopeptidase, partial [Bacteroidota bacterium]
MKYLPLFLMLSVLIGACGPNPSSQAPEEAAQPTADTSKQEPAAPTEPSRPAQTELDTSQWIDLQWLEPGIAQDIRYATANNFVKEKMYDCPRCLLRPEVARRIQQAHRQLQQNGMGLKVFDCYRPRPVQAKLWDKVPDARYVTPPAKG